MSYFRIAVYFRSAPSRPLISHGQPYSIMAFILRQRIRPTESRRLIDPRLAELQAAKEILAEIFRVRAYEVEEMIRSRMEKERALPEGSLWPATFCVGT
jgi:hypothetical protein